MPAAARRSLAELRRQNQQLTHLCRLTADIARLGDQHRTMKKIVDTAVSMIGVDAVHIALVDRDERRLFGLVTSGDHPAKSPHLKLELSECAAAREAIRTRRLVTIPNAAGDRRVNADARRRLGIGAVAYLPLLSGKVSFGLLILSHRKPHPFGAGELEIGRHFASLASVALENSRLMSHLAETEQRLRSLIEHIPAITYVCEVDPPFRTLYVSPQVGTMIGYSPDDWLTDTEGLFLKILHPEDYRTAIDFASDEAKARGFATAEYRLRDRWGEFRWFRDEAVLVRDPASTPVAWHGVVVEITGMKRGQQH